MKRIRFTKIKINWNSFFNYILLILFSSFLLLTFLIALPLTESLVDIRSFDLNIIEERWGKEYILEYDNTDQSNVNKTKNIIFNRLNRFGVEEVSITEYDNQLKIVVKSSKPEIYVDELIRNPYQYSLVTRKEGVNFEDEENALAPYLAENYSSTEFDSTTFRNIYITKLPNSSGSESYFGIAKPWPNAGNALKDFLSEYTDEYIGVDIDGFVTPVYISDPSQLAIVINSENPEEVKAIDLLYNSGNIPINYQLINEESIEIKNFSINYIEITIGLFVSILAIYLYTYFTGIYNKGQIVSTMFIVLLSLAGYLSFLKITSSPIHTFVLIIDAIILILLSNIYYQNPESRYTLFISSLAIGLIFKLLGIGYLRIIGVNIVTISIIIFLSIIISKIYFNKLSTYFKI